MFVFIDESGDSGVKNRPGQSRFFCVVLVLFTDQNEMQKCDECIDELRKRLKLEPKYEFHFRENSDKVRRAFLEAVAPYDFMCFGFVLDKSPDLLWGPGFQNKEVLYKKVCQYVFESARQHLKDAYVVLDASGSQTFQRSLKKYLRGLNRPKEGKIIKRVKTQKSSGNNLLQLADYMVGVINRNAQNKKNARDYRRFNAAKEMRVQRWP